MTALADTWSMTARDLRMLVRQPWWIAVNLVQPVIWLLLFGSLFQNVVDIPGFTGGDDYRQFLTPGIVVMTALFSSAWGRDVDDPGPRARGHGPAAGHTDRSRAADHGAPAP